MIAVRWLIVLAIFLALIILCVSNRISSRCYVFKALLYLDIFACALLLGRADMTISARCGLELRAPTGNWLLRGLGHVLNLLQAHHCELAIADDVARAKQAIEELTDTGPDPWEGA